MVEISKETKWFNRYMALCDHFAQWSKDPTTKVGAVIVDNQGRLVSMGYNGFPRGVRDNFTRLNNRETKHKFTCHAERNALDQAPGSVEGCTLYVPLFPCNECAKSIIQRGIRRVYTFVPDPNYDNPWNWDVTKQLFDEAGVDLIEYVKSDA